MEMSFGAKMAAKDFLLPSQISCKRFLLPARLAAKGSQIGCKGIRKLLMQR
jgi:hypothetical protein